MPGGYTAKCSGDCSDAEFHHSNSSQVPLRSSRKYLRIERKQIAYLKFILEGYDGMAVVSTADPAAGVIALDIGPGCEDDVNLIINALSREIRIEEICEPSPDRKPA